MLNHRRRKLPLAAALLTALTGLVWTAGWATPPSTQAQTTMTTGKGNRIEVTGNRASNIRVHCAPGTRVNINSVDIDRKALRGETVVVTGRNTQDVQIVGDCEQEPSPREGEAAPSTGNVQMNSITIR